MLDHSPQSPVGWTAKVGGYSLAVKLPPSAKFVAGAYHVSEHEHTVKRPANAVGPVQKS